MSRYRMSLDSGWDSNAFEPFKEVAFKTADKKTIVYSKIVYGEWKVSELGYPYCSKCGTALTKSAPRTNYCSCCGADMRGEPDEKNR